MIELNNTFYIPIVIIFLSFMKLLRVTRESGCIVLDTLCCRLDFQRRVVFPAEVQNTVNQPFIHYDT